MYNDHAERLLMNTSLTDPERWAKIDQLLNAALDLPAAERDAFVVAQCGNDPALLAQLRRLLGAQNTPSPLDEERGALVRDTLLREASRDWEESPPDAPVVPRFRIERELGRGGMGSVFLGARDDGAFEQRVAIKVLRRGVDTDDVLARFQRERQILASFEHPNVARLLDGGATSDGRPFLVMEHVDGDTITAWCDAQKLSTRARLELFERVCSAVEYAHQRLVVHRDLKPSNILVDRAGVPKLLDFGIAKLLDDAAVEEPSPVTRTGHLYATPRYASPEQLTHAPITTATDVYQLGVLLYELLAGVHPMASVEPTVAAMTQAVFGNALRVPSSVSGNAALRGDLDAIVLKAMRVHASDRYASVAALREDLERHRNGLPVVARVGARWYRLRRAGWRNRVALLVTSAALMAGTAYTLSLRSYSSQLEAQRNRAQEQARVAEAERSRADAALEESTRQRLQADSARTEAGLLRVVADSERTVAERERDVARDAERRASVDAARAQQTTKFMVDLFRAPGDETQIRADTISARTLLERGAERVRTELADQPEVLAPLLSAIGTASNRLGLSGYPALFDAELEALERAYGRTDARIVEALIRQAVSHERERGFSDAAMRLTAAARLQRENGATDSAQVSTLFSLANALIYAERADTAELVLRDAVLLRESSKVRSDNDRYAATQGTLAALFRRQGRLDEADSVFRAALQMPTNDTTRAMLLNNYAFLLRSRENFKEAELVYLDAVTLSRRILSPTDRARTVAANNYASVLALQGKANEALGVLEQERDTHRAHFPPDHWRVGAVEGSVSSQLRLMGRTRDAIPPRERQVAIYRQSLGESHDWTLTARLHLAEMLEEAGRTEDAARERAQIAERVAEVTDDEARAAIRERLAKQSGTPL